MPSRSSLISVTSPSACFWIYVETALKVRHAVTLPFWNTPLTPSPDGFANLAQAQALRVLDLQKNNIDMSLSQLTSALLAPLKELPRLQYLSFEANPIEVKIQNFRYFVINELPRLEFYNYTRITKEVCER